MSQRKPYNPNTKYGRRKIREEFQERYNNMPEEQRQKLDGDVWIGRLILFIVVVVICTIIIANGGKIK